MGRLQRQTPEAHAGVITEMLAPLVMQQFGYDPPTTQGLMQQFSPLLVHVCRQLAADGNHLMSEEGKSRLLEILRQRSGTVEHKVVARPVAPAPTRMAAPPPASGVTIMPNRRVPVNAPVFQPNGNGNTPHSADAPASLTQPPISPSMPPSPPDFG